MELAQNQEQLEKYREQAKALVAQMTLEEKVGQTLNWAKAVDRLGIKAYNWWNEALHGVARAGVATVFPQAITMACAFDEDMIEKVSDTISTEGRAKYNMQQQYGDTDIYKGLTFWSPNVNIFRDPRWGRGHETFGEDPFLTSRLGVRFIQGLQGHDAKYLKAAACAKHFAVHSGPEDIRHSFDAVVNNTDLYETYLPAFKACVQEAKVEAVMGAYNRTNGEACNGSKTLLQDILRGKWGFQGHVVSDCWAIKDFHEGHHVTNSPMESVALAANSGCDVNCGDLFPLLTDCVKQGMVSEERLDEMVTVLMMARLKLGTVGDAHDNPYNVIDYSKNNTPESEKFNCAVSEKCAVLLKNDGILPLKKGAIKSIGVIGPNANNRRALVGNYEGTASRYVTVLEGIQDYVGEDVRVYYSEGCHLCKDKVENLGIVDDRNSEIRGVCENSDVVICVMGLDSGLEGEEGDQGNQYASGDKPDLKLPGLQQHVLETAAACGKPVIMVLMGGSALDISWSQEHLNGILYAGYPGAQGGKAVARILFGDVSPEGKLPVTFYQNTEDLPAFTDYSMKGRTYRYMTTKPLYPFGYGLSYTKFALSDVSLSGDAVTAEGITVKAKLTNTGSVAGGEAVQVYVKAEREGTPNPQLKGLKKVFLQPGESKEVEIVLPAEAFGLYEEDCKRHVRVGDYTVYVGCGQPDARTKELTDAQITALQVKAAEEITWDC